LFPGISKTIDVVDEFLTLDGLRLIHERAKSAPSTPSVP
jgi:hypothetical protein